MITKVSAYQSSDGTAHSSLEEAQRAELKTLLKEEAGFEEGLALADVVQAIISNAETIVDILTTTPTSKPKARKVNGGTKKRTPKATTEPLPLVAAEEVKK